MQILAIELADKSIDFNSKNPQKPDASSLTWKDHTGKSIFWLKSAHGYDQLP